MFSGDVSEHSPARGFATQPNSDAYTCSRLNHTTYLVVQRDKYFEFPFIYVKVFPDIRLAAVIDTGCGSQHAADHHAQITDLKEFIERKVTDVDVSIAGLVEQGLQYLIICTHCHFDHIGGVESFSSVGANIIASSYDKSFLSPENRDANSLCPAFGMRTPHFSISKFVENGERLQHAGTDLGLRVLHTPGHTPDSMAIYDEREHWLFTGDTCYKRCAVMPWGEKRDVPIVFPLQGNWEAWMTTLDKLAAFVEAEDGGQVGPPIRLGCGHTTSDANASELIRAAKEYGRRIARGEVPVIARLKGDAVAPGGSLGDETFIVWQDDGEPEFSMCAPESFERKFKSKYNNPHRKA